MGESRCLHCIVEGQPKKEWTCQCGYGYWDAVQQKFVPGSQVRTGKALSRADYEAHLQTCSACRNKATEDDLILPTVDSPWFDGDYGPNARPWQKPKSSPGRQRKLPGQIEMFIPGKDIDADILGRYILDQVDSKGHVGRGTREVCFQNILSAFCCYADTVQGCTWIFRDCQHAIDRSMSPNGRANGHYQTNTWLGYDHQHQIKVLESGPSSFTTRSTRSAGLQTWHSPFGTP
jgi:hypothetical protein